MAIALDKCKTFHIGANNTLHEYTMGGNILEQVKEEKDLGVLIDAEIKVPQTNCSGS